jgi:hypothetical protein
MERKWCSSCQVDRPKAGFKLVTTGSKVKRWKCEFCLKREAERKYGK